MKKIKLRLKNPFSSIMSRLNIRFNYYFLVVGFCLVFTFLLISIIGNSILNHEKNVIKTQFILEKERYTKKIFDQVNKYLENMDTLPIIDLINKIGKEDDITYAYVLKSNGEVIAHTVQSEMTKTYTDKFLNTKYMDYFKKNLDKVWHKDKDFRGVPVIKFSKPIILQFAEQETLEELELDSMNEDEMIIDEMETNIISSKITNTEKTNQKIQDQNKSFFLAGVLHIAFPSDKLEFIAQSSKRQVMIYYAICYILAILFGYIIGKYLETSFSRANKTLVSVLKEVKPEELQNDHIDTFKTLYATINQFVRQYQQVSDKSGKEVKQIDHIHEQMISKLGDNVEQGIIITNQHLKVDYINTLALSLLNKKDAIKENINEVMDQYMDVIDNINKLIASKKEEMQTVTSVKKTFVLIPIFIDNELKRFIILIKGEQTKGKTAQKKQKEKAPEKKVAKPGKEEKQPEDIKSRISSRLKNI